MSDKGNFVVYSRARINCSLEEFDQVVHDYSTRSNWDINFD